MYCMEIIRLAWLFWFLSNKTTKLILWHLFTMDVILIHLEVD